MFRFGNIGARMVAIAFSFGLSAVFMATAIVPASPAGVLA